MMNALSFISAQYTNERADIPFRAHQMQEFLAGFCMLCGSREEATLMKTPTKKKKKKKNKERKAGHKYAEHILREGEKKNEKSLTFPIEYSFIRMN